MKLSNILHLFDLSSGSKNSGLQKWKRADQLAPEKCGKEKVPFINWEEIEIQEALQEDRSQHMRLICSSKNRFVTSGQRARLEKSPIELATEDVKKSTALALHKGIPDSVNSLVDIETKSH